MAEQETEKSIRPIFDNVQHASYKAILAQYPAVEKRKTPMAGHISGCVDKYFEAYIRDLNAAIGGTKIKPSSQSGKPDSAKPNAVTGDHKKAAAPSPAKSDPPKTNQAAGDGEKPAADATGTPPTS